MIARLKSWPLRCHSGLVTSAYLFLPWKSMRACQFRCTPPVHWLGKNRLSETADAGYLHHETRRTRVLGLVIVMHARLLPHAVASDQPVWYVAIHECGQASKNLDISQYKQIDLGQCSDRMGILIIMAAPSTTRVPVATKLLRCQYRNRSSCDFPSPGLFDRR